MGKDGSWPNRAGVAAPCCPSRPPLPPCPAAPTAAALPGPAAALSGRRRPAELLRDGAEVRTRGGGRSKREEEAAADGGERQLGGDWGGETGGDWLGFQPGHWFSVATSMGKRSETSTCWLRPLICGPLYASSPTRHPPIQPVQK